MVSKASSPYPSSSHQDPSMPQADLDDPMEMDLVMDEESRVFTPVLPFYQRKSFRYFLFILLAAAVIGASLGASLVLTGVFAPFGAGILGIIIVASVAALSLVVIATLAFATFQALSWFFGVKPSLDETERLTVDNEDSHEDDLESENEQELERVLENSPSQEFNLSPTSTPVSTPPPPFTTPCWKKISV